MTRLTTLAIAASFALAPLAAQAATTAGPGGFDNGYATTITYDPLALRGTSLGRDNPLNALGAPDADNSGGFFEIGFGSTVDLTFGVLFDTSTTVFEVTFGSPSGFPESADLWVGTGVGAGFSGSFVTRVSNVAAAGGAMIGLGAGMFETIRLIDTSPTSSSAQTINGQPVGGFDIDAVFVQEVAPVPGPAAGLMLLTALGGIGLARLRKSREAV